MLKQFPFDRVKPARVVIETIHLSNVDNNAAAAFMMRQGYANILGGLGKVGMSVWHHPGSSETYNASWIGPDGRPLGLIRLNRTRGRRPDRVEAALHRKSKAASSAATSSVVRTMLHTLLKPKAYQGPEQGV